MKKKSFVITMLLTAVLMIFGFIHVKAAQVTTTLAPWDVVNCWDGDKVWTDEGAKITLPGGVADAWNRRADVLANETYGPLYNIADGQTVSMSFSINLYGNDGSVISKSNNSNALDIYVMNAANDSEIMLLRIWTDSGSYNNGNHSYEIYPIFGDWGTVIYGENWIMGDAMSSSEFYLQFSKANLFESYVGGSDQITKLDNAGAMADYAYRLDGIDQIYFRIAGDNGFTADTDITIKSVNGQSLANTAGTFEDNVAPLIQLGNVNASILQDQAYTIPVNAYDLLSNDITYQILDASDAVLSNDNVFTPTTDGNQTVTLVATDSAGNASEVDLTFNVINVINPPVLSNVPTLADYLTDYFTRITFGAPMVTEDTGNYTLALYIYHADDLVDPAYTLTTLNNDGQFELVVGPDFVSGDYTLVYEATNDGGTVTSDSQTINISVNPVDTVSFVDAGTGMADFVDSGLRLRTLDDTTFILGQYDMSYGFDVKFTVLPSSTNLVNNATNGYVELVLMDPNNLNNFITMRVWLDIVNVDNPTNIFIQYDGEDVVDLSNAGWISSSVDDVSMQFHMHFDLDNYFVGERLSGMVPEDVGQTEIAAFLNTIDSESLVVGMRPYSLTDTNFFEITVTSINGQSMASTNGVLDSLADVTLAVKNEVPSMALVNEPLNFDMYLQDIYGPATYSVEIQKPDQSTETVEGLNGLYSFTPSALGDYTFTFQATGQSGNLVALDPITITVKDKVSVPTMTLASAYEGTYALGDSISIIQATFSDDVVTSSILVTIQTPSGDTETVQMGDSYTFSAPGIYQITYAAEDNASPTPNQISESYSINVPDDVLPVIAISDMPEKATVNKVISIEGVTITEDSTYTLSVVLVSPQGDEQTLTVADDNSFSFTPTEKGLWHVTLTVTDLYDNVQTATYDIQVNALSTGALIGIISGAVVVVAGILGGLVLFKRR